MSDDIRKLVDATEKEYKSKSSPTGEQNAIPQLPEDLIPFSGLEYKAPTFDRGIATSETSDLPDDLKAFNLNTPQVDNSALSATEDEPVSESGIVPAFDTSKNINPGLPADLESVLDPTLGKRPGLLEAAKGAVIRGGYDTLAMAPVLAGVASEITGDVEAADARFREAQALEALAPKAVTNGIEDIYNLEDFTYWGIERLGEQAAVLGTLITGAGTAGGLTALVGKGLLKSKAKRALATKVAVNTGGIGTGIALETGGSAKELKEATGSYQPATALTVGAINGLLEWYTPYKLAKGWGDEGVGIVEGVIKGTLSEGLTEAGQEITASAARAFEDQNYQFFSKENGLRIINAAAAGAFVGGTLGGGAKLASRATRESEGRTLSEKELDTIRNAPVEPEIEFDNVTTWDNPLRWLREKFQRKGENRDLTSVNTLPEKEEDYSELSSLLTGIRKTWENAKLTEEQYNYVRDFEDAVTPRYMIKRADGSFSPILNDTDTELELIKQPQNYKHEIYKVDLQTLAAGSLTAEVFDLPATNDARIFFMPWVKDEVKPTLINGYNELLKQKTKIGDIKLTGTTEEITLAEDLLENLYKPLVTQGLRVIPSPGASFIYSGKANGKLVKDFTAERFIPGTFKIKFDQYTGKDYLNATNPSISTPLTTASEYITVDLNKLRYEDGYIEVSPTVMQMLAINQFLGNLKQFVWFKSTLSIAEQNKLLDKFGSALKIRENPPSVFEALWKEGIALSPKTFSKITSNLSAVVPSAFIIKQDIRKKLIPGVYIPAAVKRRAVTVSSNSKNLTQFYTYNSSVTPSISGIENILAKYKINVTPEIAKQIKQLFAEAKTLTQELRSGLSEFALKYKLPDNFKLSISEGKTPLAKDIYDMSLAAYYDPNNDHIEISLSGAVILGLDKRAFGYVGSRSLKTFLYEIILHEYGHYLAATQWTTLPFYQKERLYSAYNKALLDARINKKVTRSGQPSEAKEVSNQAHYDLTFSEWLAEQFRRWATSDTNARTRIEKFFTTTANQFEQFYKFYSEQFGEHDAKNLMYPSWEFTSVMEYLYELNNPSDKLNLSNVARKSVSLPLDGGLGIGTNAAVVEITEAYNEFKHLLRSTTQTLYNLEANTTAEATTFGMYTPSSDIIQIWAGSLGMRNSGLARKTFVHEAAHSVFNLFTEAEKQIIINAGKRLETFKNEHKSVYVKAIRDFGKQVGWDEATLAEQSENFLNEEYFATMLDSRIDGKSYSSEVNKILDLILNFFERIWNLSKGLGYVSLDDIIHAFYSGEITKREDEALLNQTAYRSAVASIMRPAADIRVGSSRSNYFKPQTIKYLKDRDLYVAREVIGSDQEAVLYKFYKPGKTKPTGHVLNQLDQLGVEIGAVDLANRKALGFEVSSVNVNPDFRRQGFATYFYEYLQNDLNIKEMKPSGILEPDGYEMWKKRDPLKVRWHVFDEITGVWLSPNYINNSYNKWIAISKSRLQKDPNADNALLTATIVKYKKLQDKINPLAYKDPNLATAFNMEPNAKYTRAKIEHMLYEKTKAQEIDDNNLLKAFSGINTGELSSTFDKIYNKEAEESKEKNAKILNIDVSVAAAEQMETAGVVNIIQWANRGEQDPETNRRLTGLSGELDRISWFSKVFISIKQLAWRNQHLRPLLDYTNFVETMNNFRMAMVTQADTVAREWNTFPEQQRTAIADYLFWLTEMRYRSPTEVQTKVIRMPTLAEIGRQQQLLRLDINSINLITRIQEQFTNFLNETELISADLIRTTYAANPQGMQAALAKLAADMAQLRKKPYFPMVRFGQWHITARDENNKVVFFAAYPTQRERDRALQQVVIQYRGNAFQVGRIPQEVQEFMGLPGPLIDRILDPAEGMPDITTQQRKWLENFKVLNGPENSFRKRWLERKGTPGYSLDAFRVYANYFITGSGYLAKLKYKNVIRSNINELRATLPTLRDTRKRTYIIDMVENHYKYIMENGRDFSKLKSLISMWQLGFSPAAAAMNLLQSPTVTYPYLAGLFGDVKALGALRKSVNALKRSTTYSGTAPLAFEAARQELQAMGKLDVGQAAELGAYAEGSNLLSMAAGTDLQRGWRNLSWAGMYLFGKAESINREIAFASMWELALANSDHTHLAALERANLSEVNRLLAKTYTVNGQSVTLTYDQALAVIAAREAIDRTQFMFQPWTRPKFLQNRYSSVFLVFFGYVQALVYAMGNNPGMIRMFLIYAFLFGLMALPGAEDADELLKMLTRLSHKYFGLDFSLEKEVRSFVNSITKDSMFEKTGADLLLHGISKYSFGLGLLQEGYGIPQFDAHANGSIGKLIPGLAEVMRGVGAGANWRDITGQLAKDTSGAGFGLMFPLLQFLGSDSFTADQRKWEAVMPRALKAMSKAYRYGTEGKEVTPRGSTVVNFDLRDPDDLATIVTQGLGFTPTKLSKEWELKRAFQDEVQWLTARRMALMLQFDYAIRSRDSDAIKSMREKINSFNTDMRQRGVPTMSITSESISSSLKNRAQIRAKESMGLPAIKSQGPLMQQLRQELHAPGPGSSQIIEQKKVK